MEIEDAQLDTTVKLASSSDAAGCMLIDDGAPGGYDGSSVIEIGSLLWFVELSEELPPPTLLSLRRLASPCSGRRQRNAKKPPPPRSWIVT
jgi:hypothetical protein